MTLSFHESPGWVQRQSLLLVNFQCLPAPPTGLLLILPHTPSSLSSLALFITNVKESFAFDYRLLIRECHKILVLNFYEARF